MLNDEEEEDEYLPDDQEEGEYANLSPMVRELLRKSERMHASGPSTDDDEVSCPKVYYASRTHSQLSQVVPEMNRLMLKRTPNNSSSSVQAGLKRAHEDTDEDSLDRFTRTVALGSRKQLCINEDVRKLKDVDEGCRALLEAKGGKRCPYLPTQEEEYKMIDFRDEILASPKDIEDLAEAGRIANTCPYFGSRKAIPQAQLVTLPYNLLLQKTARDALGIDLKGQVVVIDEAHNLISSLLSLSTARLTLSTIQTCLDQLLGYLKRFRTRLAAKHAVHLKRLAVFLNAVKTYMQTWSHGRQGNFTEVILTNVFVERLGKTVASINLLEIEGYLRSSKVAHKIASYSDKQSEKEGKGARRVGATPPLYDVVSFILSLVGRSDDGRITLSMTSDSPHVIEVKYQLLNPSPHFAQVVEDARCVILAGGTMAPMSDVINQLFADLPSERLSTFSCGHIIPASSLRTVVVSQGPRGQPLEFTSPRQKDPAVVAELGQILMNLASCIQYGMVVFFPSYSFLNACKAAWQSSGILDRVQTKKKVYYEPEESAKCEQVLREYAAEIATPTTGRGPTGGALLLAVVGAKLSEGLNFSDNLARAVIIVGLPYANLGSPELQERLRYVKALAIEKKLVKRPGEQDADKELYENMCMNAVNQSIGRAIRHKGDWAALVLLDRRYGGERIQGKLPRWIGDSVSVASTFGQAMKTLGTFYRERGTGTRSA